MSKSHLRRFIHDDLLTLLFPNVSRDVHRLQRRPAPRPLQALAILVVTKSNKRERKKGHSFFFVIGSLHHTPTQAETYHTLALYTYTHSCTHHFVKLHISKQVPLFHKCSDRTTNPDRVNCYSISLSIVSFFFFWKTDKKTKLLCQSSVPQWRHVPQPKTDLFSINVPDTCFSPHNDFVLIFTSYKVLY